MAAIQVEGLEEVIAEIERRGGNVRKALEDICKIGAEVIRAEAAGNAPGSISGAMLKRTSKKRRTLVEVSVGPHRKKFYARFVEYGTSPHLIRRGVIGGIPRRNIRHPGARPRPFLRPALDTKHDDAQGKMGEKIQGLVEQ